MNINPYILLGIGSLFALLYASVITFGWARTRRNRRKIQQSQGMSEVSTWILDESIADAPKYIKTVSLTNNSFVDAEGVAIDVSQYIPYIAIGQSKEYPQIQSGDLVLKDKDGVVRYIFEVPDLSCYR